MWIELKELTLLTASKEIKSGFPSSLCSQIFCEHVCVLVCHMLATVGAAIGESQRKSHTQTVTDTHTNIQWIYYHPGPHMVDYKCV